MLAPARFASPARTVNSLSNQSIPAFRSRSFEFFSDRYSTTSLRPASFALRSASDNAAAHASSSSLIFAWRWYHEPRNRPPTIPDAEHINMTRSRALTRLLTVMPAVGLFLLLNANPFAQSNKLPAPSTHVSDFAGVMDAETKTRLESLLQGVKEKSKIDLYVSIVDSTGAQEIAAFSQQLARDWNIGAKTTRGKSMLLVVSAASKSSFTQFTRAAQADLPDGVLGEMSYRMSGPLNDGRLAEAVDSGVHAFASAVAEKIGFNVSELETSALAANSPEVVVESHPVLVNTRTPRTRPRVVS